MTWNLRAAALRTQFLLLTLVTSLTGLAGVTVFVTDEWNEALQLAYSSSYAVAKRVATDFEGALRDHELALSAVAARPRVAAMDPHDCDSMLTAIPWVVPALTSVTVRRLDSTVVCSSSPTPLPKLQPAEAQRIAAAARSGRLAVSDAQPGAAGTRWITRMSYPVRGDNGKIVGVVTTALDLEAYGRRLFSEVSEDVLVLVQDRSGSVAMRSMGDTQWIGRKVPERISRLFTSSEGRFRIPDLNGEQRIGSYVTARHAGWIVALGFRESEFLDPLRTKLYGMSAVALALLALVIWVAWRLARNIELPVRRLAQVVDRVGAGDLAARARTEGAREVAHLADEFNRMLDALMLHRQEQDALQRALQEQIVGMETAQEMALLGPYEIDLETRTIRLSARAVRLFGIGEDALYCPLEEFRRRFHHPDDMARTVAIAEQAFRQNRTVSTVSRGVRANGDVFWFETRAKKIEGTSKWVGVMQDITDRKRVEDELRTLSQHLEGLVEQRTRDLADARERADAANAAKSSFLANMSHEIRTPLNAIVGLTYLLRRDGLTGRQAARLDQIDASTKHLLQLVNDILDISKIEAERMELECTDVRLADLVREVADLVRPEAQGKSLRLTCECRDLPEWVRGDPTRLRQALLNYLSNAVKFCERGEVIIRCSATALADESVLARFEVQDTGPGVAPETLPRLFQAFEQGDNSTTRQFGGTGLGLAITKRLAGMMGGEVGATSAPGAGTTFWFTARLARATGATPAPENDRDHLQLLREAHAGARVLLVEDNDISAEVVTDLVRDASLAVERAADGPQGIAMARQAPYDIVLMDVQLPGLDGVATTAAIRALAGWRDRPIIALTANVYADDRRRCLEGGMNDFLGKPLMPRKLYAMLAKWLDRRSAAERASRDAPPARSPQPRERADHDAALERIAAAGGMDAQRVLSFRARAGRYLELLAQLCTSHEDGLQSLDECLRAGDLERAMRTAHSLKGAAAMLGAERLGRLSARLEAALRGHAASELARPILADMRDAVGAVSAALAEARTVSA